MAGTIVANTINTDTGLFSTNNAYSGIAKAWVQFTGSTGATTGSFNVSSVTRSGTGVYVINFATAMTNANYAVAGICSTTSGDYVYVLNTASDNVPTTTTLPIYASYTNTSGLRHDSVLNSIIVFGA